MYGREIEINFDSDIEIKEGICALYSQREVQTETLRQMYRCNQQLQQQVISIVLVKNKQTKSISISIKR